MNSSFLIPGKGVCIGKFLPPHAGHEYLLRFGASYVQELVVLLCSLPSEPISGELRLLWMKELFPRLNIIHVQEELPQYPEEHPRFWQVWNSVLRRYAGEGISHVFASEEYGQRLASDLDARFIAVDPRRSQLPVSGTAVRENPYAYWEYLSRPVRSYFVKKVSIFGPESTGKTTLAQQLAERFRSTFVREYAWDFLEVQGRPPEAGDMEHIALAQAAREKALLREANTILFCDTDVLATKLWDHFLFEGSSSLIRRLAEESFYDHTLLLDVDVPFVPDEKRYLPHRRAEFLEASKKALEESGRPYTLISGGFDERFSRSVRVLQDMFPWLP